MTNHKIVSLAEWIEARRVLLADEKVLTRLRDRLAEQRRALPWVRVEKDYLFDSVDGPVTLAELFDGRSQLAVYHFMFGPDWQEGCPGCSFLCDQVDGARQHFEHADLSFVAVSRGRLEQLQAYRKRMGWTFRWVSSASTDFNVDFRASFPDGTRDNGVFYNFEQQDDPGVDELSGVSVFFQDSDGAIYLTYASFARGGEMFLPAYAWLDITPKGRNEGEGDMQAWMRRHDRYENDGRTRPLVCSSNRSI